MTRPSRRAWPRAGPGPGQGAPGRRPTPGRQGAARPAPPAEAVVAAFGPGPGTVHPPADAQDAATAHGPDPAAAQLTQRRHHLVGKPARIVGVGPDDDGDDSLGHQLDLA